MTPPAEIAPEDSARAELYAFLAAILSGPPPETLLTQVRGLAGDDETELGLALADLSRVAAGVDAAAAEREFNALFIGLGRGELLPYASYYLTGNLHDKPLARLRSDMASLGIVRADNVFEPEDNISSVLEMMAGQILGHYGASQPLEKQADFFATHVQPWAGRFFTDLEAAKTAELYAPVGTLGAAFMRIEKEAFQLA
ncbi:molecular chaperone [Palleronia sp.]|uniref:TorD/DmsD family molecular chaperone n=1 Tax=Palleronia sp. TaxID=1940284 RepID=UPI0035C8357C